MQLLIDLWNNDPLKCAALSWTVAQTLKVLISLALDKHLDWKRLWGMGGMPLRASMRFSSLELAGRLAGRGYSSLVQAWTCWSLPASLNTACASSNHVASPSQVT